MKAILVALLLFSTATAHADPPDLAARARRKRNAGIALTVVGGITLIGGLVCTGYGAAGVGGGDPFGVGAMVLGAGIAGDLLGLGMLIPGAILWAQGQRDLGQLAPPTPTVLLTTPVLRF